MRFQRNIKKSNMPNWMRGSSKPDFIIGGTKDAYLLRWYITPWSGCCRKDSDGKDIEFATATLWQKFVRTLPNIYLHKILKDDDDRALHDHPWASISLILKGGFYEVTPKGTFWRRPGRAYWRAASALHRLQLPGTYKVMLTNGPNFKMGQRLEFRNRCWSLFITGPRLREWGFACPKGWVHWRIFTAKHNHGEVGAGCGEA